MKFWVCPIILAPAAKPSILIIVTAHYRLYNLYNKEAFDECLPKDMVISWCPNLRKTAGTCSQGSKTDGKNIERTSSIKLSLKVNKTILHIEDRVFRSTSKEIYVVHHLKLFLQVLDSPNRLRDTLVHEMCHAAAWTISGYKDGHGVIWKNWAGRAMKRFPELPIIGRCHSYKIRTKYVYRCSFCKTGMVDTLHSFIKDRAIYFK